MPVHPIRLAGPWKLIQGAADSVRIQLPYCLPEDVQCGVIRRRFHRPSGLEADTQVRIALTAESDGLHVSVNGTRISQMAEPYGHRILFDISAHLEAFNTLDVQLTQSSARLESAELEIVET